MTSHAWERAQALASEAEPARVRPCCGTEVERETCECAENERAILAAESRGTWRCQKSVTVQRCRECDEEAVGSSLCGPCRRDADHDR